MAFQFFHSFPHIFCIPFPFPFLFFSFFHFHLYLMSLQIKIKIDSHSLECTLSFLDISAKIQPIAWKYSKKNKFPRVSDSGVLKGKGLPLFLDTNSFFLIFLTRSFPISPNFLYQFPMLMWPFHSTQPRWPLGQNQDARSRSVH